MEIKKQIYIIISVFFLVAVFLSVFLIYPIHKEIVQKSEEMIIQRNNKLILESQFSEAEKFKQKYENYKPNLLKINALFVDSKNPVTFIEFLEGLASESKVNLQISTPTSSKEGSLSYQNFQLSSSGSFAETLKFLRKIEAGPYLIKIQNLSIGGAKLETKTKNPVDIVAAEFSIKVSSK